MFLLLYVVAAFATHHNIGCPDGRRVYIARARIPAGRQPRSRPAQCSHPPEAAARPDRGLYPRVRLHQSDPRRSREQDHCRPWAAPRRESAGARPPARHRSWPTYRLQILQKLRGRRNAGDEQPVTRSSCRHVQQLALGGVDVVEFHLVGDLGHRWRRGRPPARARSRAPRSRGWPSARCRGCPSPDNSAASSLLLLTHGSRSHSVMPAKAGIPNERSGLTGPSQGTPASAGVTMTLL